MGRNGSGVREASAGSYEITFTYRGVRCRERVALKPSPANLKRVTRHRENILEAISLGTFDYATTFPDSPRKLFFGGDKPITTLVTVEQFLQDGWINKASGAPVDGWIKTECKRLKASTARDDTRTVAIICRQFRDLPLIELKRPLLRDWLKTMECSNKRLKNIQSVLRRALKEAMESELIEVNPLHGWLYVGRDKPKTEDDVRPFTAEEQALILAQLQGQERNLVQFAFWTGLRTSELIALEWRDINWQTGYVRVSRAKTTASSVHEDTKTRAGRRDVKLLPPALEALRAQKEFTALPGKEVFQNPRTGKPWSEQKIRETTWERALRRAGVDYRRPYQTRHTYASMMLTAGENPKWVAAQMGHADVSMINRVYGRWIPDAAPDAGNKAVAMFTIVGSAVEANQA